MTKTAEYWKSWIKAAGIRAIKTVAQTAVATIGSSAVLGDVSWGMVASAAALAGILLAAHQRCGVAGNRERRGSIAPLPSSKQFKPGRFFLPGFRLCWDQSIAVTS